MPYSIRVTKRVLQFILSTEYPVVYRHPSKGLIEGHRVTLYSTDPIPGKVAAIGAWSGGVFVTEGQRLAKVINTVTKGQ